MKYNQRKKILLILFMVSAISLSSTSYTYAEENKNKIVCTNSVLADFTSNILKDNFTIDYLMPAGACPSQYDTTPSDINKIISADIVISFGSPKMEGWLNDLLIYNQECKIIECGYIGEWNIPSGAKKYVEIIRNELLILIPDNYENIMENSEKYLLEIDKTSIILQNMIKNNSMVDKKIICMQWHKDFIEFLGLNVTYSYGSPSTLSLSDEIDIINVASNREICAIIDNLQSGTDLGSRIASDSGASHIIFTNFPKAIPGTDNYLDMISYNTKKLIEGVKSYENKQGGIFELESQINLIEFQRNIFIVITVIMVILSTILFLMYKKNKL